MKKLKITELNRLTIDEYRLAEKIPLVVVLDNIRSMHNVGSVFRTADAFLVQSIYLCGITNTPPNPQIHKTALGAEETVHWEYFKNTIDAISKLKDIGYKILAIEQVKGSTTLKNITLSQNEKFAIILGNEVKGVQQTIVDLCDECVEIPQFGTKHSLNVSVTSGIVLWEFFKKLSPKLKHI